MEVVKMLGKRATLPQHASYSALTTLPPYSIHTQAISVAVVHPSDILAVVQAAVPH